MRKRKIQVPNGLDVKTYGRFAEKKAWVVECKLEYIHLQRFFMDKIS
jgi:hypothetical protein